MPITDKIRKSLWGRSGSRCAICKHELVVDATAVDDESIVGDECHIISPQSNGPRHDSSYPQEKLDMYENRILLCRIHHKIVDDQQETYTGKTYSGKTKKTGRNKVTLRPQEEWFLLPDVTPPIVDEEVFKRTQEAITQAKQSRPIKQNSPYLLTGFIRCSKCGSTIGGTTLNDKYRYYQCRGARPTTTRGKICDAGYIKADRLESEVWKKVVEMTSSPTTILLRQYEHEFVDRIDPIVSFDKQIDKLRRKLKTYSIKEKNLYSLLQHDSVTKEYVIETVDNLRQERLNDKRLLEQLLFSRKQAKQAERFDVKLTQISESLLKDLQSIEVDDSFSNHFKDKRSFLKHICLEVIADPESFKFNFRLGALILSSSKEDAIYGIGELIKNFEQKHPEINAQDLVDLKYLLPEDEPLAQLVNPVKKDLVTIEQTSACLLVGNKKQNKGVVDGRLCQFLHILHVIKFWALFGWLFSVLPQQ